MENNNIFTAAIIGNLDYIVNYVNHNKNLNIIDEYGWTPLMLAIKFWKIECAKIIIKSGNCNLNYQRSIDFFLSEKSNPLILACEINNFELVELLIKHNCDLNVTNTKGETPLMISIRNNSEDIVNILIESGCDINLHDSSKHSPLILLLNIIVILILLKNY